MQPSSYPTGPTAYQDPEDPEAKGFEFNDESIRKAFIRKVYSILTVSICDYRYCDLFYYQMLEFYQTIIDKESWIIFSVFLKHIKIVGNFLILIRYFMKASRTRF